MPEYGNAEYWNARYTADDNLYDWYASYEQLEKILRPLAGAGSRILILGCGNSSLGAQLYNAGYENVVNVDVSEVCIAKMRAQCSSMPRMQWVVGDCTQLNFPSESFDVVFDKGTLDALLCGPQALQNAYRMNCAVQRVLRTGGHFIEVTCGSPDFRLCLLQQAGLSWKVQHRILETGTESVSGLIHVYTMLKVDAVSHSNDLQPDARNGSAAGHVAGQPDFGLSAIADANVRWAQKYLAQCTASDVTHPSRTGAHH
eukprot:GGOE01037669.1.p1 GENE.GGOE01037669.1~~GGOE01037669.1.p1  ORF type:complete len:257 (+),score=36.92 GGOE01037669.1:106-876(+)